MNDPNFSNENKEELGQNKLQNILANIKSNFILKKIFANTHKIKFLSLI